MNPKKKKNRNILRLTLAFFLPVALLVTILFSVSVIVFQNSLNQLDYEILDFENIDSLKENELSISSQNRELAPADNFRTTSFEALNFDASFTQSEADMFHSESISDDEDFSDEVLDLTQGGPLTRNVSLLDPNPEPEFDIEIYQSELQQNIDTYLDNAEKDAYRNAFGKILPVFLFLIFLTLIFSYVSAKLMVRPVIKMAEKQKRFIADASHEIKTPLSLMKSEIEVFRKMHESSEPDKEEVKSLTGNLLEDINRLSALSEKLLYIARLDSKKDSPAINKNDCDFTDLVLMIEDLVKSFSLKYLDKEISFTKENFPANLIADCENIRQVVEILVENACLHMVGGKKITVNLSKDKNIIRIRVADNGKGISPEDGPKVFDRFYRSKNSSGTEGTGLGLSIAKELVEKDGGSIILDPNQEGGATFIVSYKLDKN